MISIIYEYQWPAKERWNHNLRLHLRPWCSRRGSCCFLFSCHPDLLLSNLNYSLNGTECQEATHCKLTKLALGRYKKNWTWQIKESWTWQMLHCNAFSCFLAGPLTDTNSFLPRELADTKRVRPGRYKESWTCGMHENSWTSGPGRLYKERWSLRLIADTQRQLGIRIRHCHNKCKVIQPDEDLLLNASGHQKHTI